MGKPRFQPLDSPAFICLLLVLATLAVYSPVRHYGFVDFDDSGYFFANPHVLGGLTGPNVKWAFTSGEDANWHPLTWLSLMLDATLFGQGAAAPHVTNVLLHAANSILVFWLLWRTTGKMWRSAAVAMLFAVHPLHVESVAWVSERKDVLSGFFSLLTLLCYARHAANSFPKTETSAVTTEHRLSPSYWWALFFFICGLMSKPMAVTLPFVMLLMDFWPLECLKAATLRRLILEKIPFFLLSVAASAVTFLVQKKGGAVNSLTLIPLGMRLENPIFSYLSYLLKIVWPIGLATPYPGPHYWPLSWLIPAGALMAAFCLAAFAVRKRFPFVFTGWFWFAGMLVPVIGLVQVGGAAMADRYVYIPIIGILIIACWGIGEVCRKWQPPSSAAIGLAALLFFICALRARNQVSTWQNGQTLFGHALSVTRYNYIANLNMGYWYSKNGDPEKALEYYRQALSESPDSLYNVGNALSKLGRWDEAIQDYRRALHMTPNEPDILDNLGFALAHNKQVPEATACFEAVLKLKPDSVGAHNNLATILFEQGNYAEAAAQYSAAVQLAPNDPRIIINLADTLLRMGEKNAAAQCYQHALDLEPDNQTVRDKLQSLGVE